MTTTVTQQGVPELDQPGGLVITVYAMPASQGSKRYVGRAGGRGVMVESSKKLPGWRQAVREAALACIYCSRPFDGKASVLRSGYPLDQPLAAAMTFTLPKPVSAPKRRRTWPDRMPDLSKLVRSTEDALTDAGVWRDDARVIAYRRLAKVYPNEGPDALPIPGVLIRIWSVSMLEDDLPGARHNEPPEWRPHGET